MIGKVTIANMALMRCGNYTQLEKLDAGNPSTPEELLATRFYDDTRRECLTMGPWNFAEKEVVLTPIANWPTTGKWPFAFAYPADCIMAREIALDLNTPAAGYEVNRSNFAGEYQEYVDDLKKFVVGNMSKPPGQNTKIIKANAQFPTLTYTVDLDLPDHYSPAFASMFSWRLAMSFAGALGLSAQQAEGIMRGFLLDKDAALAINANEGDDDQVQPVDWLTARL